MPIALFDLSLVRARLKAEAPGLRIVAGAADLAALRDAPPLVLPAAYVLPLSESPGRSTSGTVLVSQRNAVRFAVVLAAANLRDARGEAAQDDLRVARESALAALIGWEPDPAIEVIEFAAGRLVSLSDQVLWWQDEFLTAHWLRTE
jgi:hypothetical protein